MRKNILFGGNFFLFKPFLSFCLVLCWKGYLLALIFAGRASPAGMSTPHSRQRAVRCSWCLQSSGGWQVLSAPAVLAAPGQDTALQHCSARPWQPCLLRPQGAAPSSTAPFTFHRLNPERCGTEICPIWRLLQGVALCSVQGRPHTQPDHGGAMRFSLAVTPLSALIQMMQEMSV